MTQRGEVYYHGQNMDDSSKFHNYETVIILAEFPLTVALLAMSPLVGGSFGVAAVLYNVAILDRHFSKTPFEKRVGRTFNRLIGRS